MSHSISWNAKELLNRTLVESLAPTLAFCAFHSLPIIIGLKLHYMETMHIAVGLNPYGAEELLPSNLRIWTENMIALDTYPNDTRTAKQKQAERDEKYRIYVCKYIRWDPSILPWACDFVLILLRLPEAVYQDRKKDMERKLLWHAPKMNPNYQYYTPEEMDEAFYGRQGIYRNEVVSPFEAPGAPEHTYMYRTVEVSEKWHAEQNRKK